MTEIGKSSRVLGGFAAQAAPVQKKKFTLPRQIPAFRRPRRLVCLAVVFAYFDGAEAFVCRILLDSAPAEFERPWPFLFALGCGWFFCIFRVVHGGLAGSPLYPSTRLSAPGSIDRCALKSKARAR